MRILYGGTFDPVHLGHIAIAEAVARELGQPVDLIPAADPPHRSLPGASAEQRATLLDLAVRCDPRLRVDRRELGRPGPSYTVDTLREVRGELGPEVPLVWIVGIDSLLQLHTWHDWRRIFDFAHVLGVERPGTSTALDWLEGRSPDVHSEIAPRALPVDGLGEAAAGGYASLSIHPLREESATEVRRRIAEGLPWQHMVPALVAGHIRELGLYGAGLAA